MRVILTQDMDNLGDAGEIVKVKPGYGRNFLLPKGLALLATESRVKELEHKRRVIDEKVRKEVSIHEAVKQKLDGTKLAFEVQAGVEGKLFGSVTTADIHQRLTELSFEVNRRKIQLAQPIKQLGDYEVVVKLHRDVSAQIVVNVVSDGTEPPAPEPEPDEEPETEREVERDEHSDDEPRTDEETSDTTDDDV